MGARLRIIALMVAAIAWTGAAVGEPLDLAKASTSSRPIIARQAGLVVAMTFPRDSAAKLFIQEGGVQRESREFQFPHAANHGAAWVEHIEIKSRLNFVVHIRTRQTCGPGLHAFTFAYRGGEWLVAGLDRQEHECSDEGPVAAWSKSYNFLGGRIEGVRFVKGHRDKTVVERKQFPQFRMVDFDPFDSGYESAALATEKGHCARDETVVFECWIGSGIASVCGSRGPKAAMQYRYGRPGKPEILAPLADTRDPAPSALVYNNPLGVGEGYLRFTRGSYSYVPYQFSSREMPVTPNSAQVWRNWSGVAVFRGAGKQSVLRCDRHRGVVAEFDPRRVYGEFGLPDRTDQIHEDLLLPKLQAWLDSR